MMMTSENLLNLFNLRWPIRRLKISSFLPLYFRVASISEVVKEETTAEQESLRELKDPLSSLDVEDVQFKPMTVESEEIATAQSEEPPQSAGPCETVTLPAEDVRPCDVDSTADAVRENLRLDSHSSVEDLRLQSSPSSQENEGAAKESPEKQQGGDSSAMVADEKSDNDGDRRSIMDEKEEETTAEQESLRELKDPLSSLDVEDVQFKPMTVESEEIATAQSEEPPQSAGPCETVTLPAEDVRPCDVDSTADAVRENLRLDSHSSVEDLRLQSSPSSQENEGAAKESPEKQQGGDSSAMDARTADTAEDSDSDGGLLPLSRRLRRIFSESEEEDEEDNEKEADRSRIEDTDHATDDPVEGSEDSNVEDGMAESSDSTSSDDEPPPAFGRWMTSGGAAKKAPRTPGGARGDSGVSGEERSPKASRRTKADAENLIAIHSESQRMVREADVNLPYHEPRQFSKFSEFKAMLDEEEEEEDAVAIQQHRRRRKRSPTPPAQCPAVENMDAQKAATAEWIESLPSKPSSPSAESQSSKTGETATGENTVGMAASTPYHSKSAEPRKLPLSIPKINFDVDLDACSLPDQSSIHGSSAAASNKEEEAPLALRLRLNNRLMNALRQDDLDCVPKLGSPDHSGFIDLNPKKEQFPDRSFDSTGSTHPMLRKLRRHMKPSPREAKRAANKSIEIITKTADDADGERLKLEEIRLMPPPPNPPRLSASSRAANWKAHREQLKEEMRIKRLKGLEERQRFWDIIHKEEEEEGTKNVRSLDDMDSDDEEFVPGEESEEESEDDDEEEEEEEEENADDEEEEEETRRSAGKKSEFIDEEAEEEDEDEPRFDGSLPNSPIDLRLSEEDDDAVMADDQPSCKSASLYSRKLSLTSTTRDLFASDPEEISSVRSSVSSIFQPGQRSYIIPDEMSLHSGASNRRISETYQLAEGQAPAEATLVWNEQQNSTGYDDPYEVRSKADSASREPTPMASPVKLSTQGAHSLFHSAPNWLDGDMDEVAADLFMKATQGDAQGTQSSQADLFASTLSHNRSSLESAKPDSEDDEMVVTVKRKSRVLADSSDEDAEENAEIADPDAESVEEVTDEDEGDDADTEYESEGVVDEEDDEMAVMKRIEANSGKSRSAPKLSDFVEAEAELSGSEGDVSSDENEVGLDREDEEDAEWIDKDSSVGDARLRQEVERVHARMERDDDQRAVRYLQELYLPDGDLTPGESLRKRFRWRGLDDGEEEEEAGPFIESEEEDEENQISFVDDRRPTGNLDVSTASADSGTAAAKEDEEEASQLFRLGQSALQTKLRQAPETDPPQSQARSQMSGFGLVKRGSFLSKATSDLGRIRDILRQSDNSSLRNKAGVVCFSVGAGSESAAKKQAAPKRPSTEGYEPGKKICLSGKPLTSVNSIFNSIDGK